MSSRKFRLSSWAEVRVKLQMWLTVCRETQSMVRNQADSSETGPGTEAMGRRTWQVKYAPQSDRRWVRSGLAGVRLKNILETDRVRSSYDGGILKVTVLRPAMCFWPLKVKVMSFNLFVDLDASLWIYRNYTHIRIWLIIKPRKNTWLPSLVHR